MLDCADDYHFPVIVALSCLAALSIERALAERCKAWDTAAVM
ncbi:hypothetical protein [Enterococcus faecium]